MWTGELTLPDKSSIKDIAISALSDSPSAKFPQDASLSFLAIVDVAQIPLYLTAGPILDVHTSNADTETFFCQTLLRDDVGDTKQNSPPWWHTRTPTESPLGILARLDGTQEKAADGCVPVTELLFYCYAIPQQTPPPSPTLASITSSPPQPLITLHTLPLSSTLLYRSAFTPTPPLSPSAAPTSPSFLPFPPTVSKPSHKCTASLFDAAVAARHKRPRPPPPPDPTTIPPPHKRTLSVDLSPFTTTAAGPRPGSKGSIGPPAIRDAARRSHSRSPSLGAGGWDTTGGPHHHHHPHHSAALSRPGSRRGDTAGTGRRPASGLSRGVNAAEGGDEDGGGVEARNREALSRVVLAAMRMHGLSRPKGEVVEADEADEYKMVYHHVFKAAAFALRRALATRPLQREVGAVREMVDRLVAMMAVDPLAGSADEGIGGDGREGEEDAGGGESPFMVSKKKRSDMGQSGTIGGSGRDGDEREEEAGLIKVRKRRDK